jgi:hypothetical protein
LKQLVCLWLQTFARNFNVEVQWWKMRRAEHVAWMGKVRNAYRFVVLYFTTMSVSGLCSFGWYSDLMNDIELNSIWSEVVVVYLRYYLGIFQEERRKSAKHFS